MLLTLLLLISTFSSLSPAALPACSALSEQFCETLWNPPAEGNLPTSRGRILVGNSLKSEVSMRKMADFEVLLESEARIPADLRSKVAPVLKRIRQHLAREQMDEAWQRGLSRLEIEFNDLVSDVALARTTKKHPELRAMPVRDRTFDQRSWVYADLLDLRTEILRAKYEKHPNWKRVENLFEQTRNDLVAEIEQLKLPSELRKQMVEKVMSVKLMLPFEDPKLMGSSYACGSDELNAYYSSTRNRFTVCAGLFNGLQDDGWAPLIIAHELSHSIDTQELARTQFFRSPIGATLKRFCRAPGAVMPCEEWAGVRREVFARAAAIPEPNPPLRPLSSCLKSEKELKPWVFQELRQSSDTTTRNRLHHLASDNDFTYLAQPTIRQRGKDIPNDYYFRPDRIWASDRKFQMTDEACLDMVEPAIFAQILECKDYRKAPADQRADVFESGLKELEEIRSTIHEAWIGHCGRDCSTLLQFKLGRPVDEDVADWLAQRVLARAVKREGSLTRRREMVDVAQVFQCTRPGALWGAKDLAEREKKWSFEPHPDRTQRRMRLFTPEMAELLQCERDPQIQKFATGCTF